MNPTSATGWQEVEQWGCKLENANNAPYVTRQQLDREFSFFFFWREAAKPLRTAEAVLVTPAACMVTKGVERRSSTALLHNSEVLPALDGKRELLA